MENERGKSLVNIVPRNNEVLIKMEFKVSLLELSAGKPSEEGSANERVTYSVAGIGPLVKDLTIGEEVLMKLTGSYDDVPVKDNVRSIRELTKFYTDPKSISKTEFMKLLSDPSTSKVDVIQYGLFPEFQIKAHIE
jgi:hypothetical protein